MCRMRALRPAMLDDNDPLLAIRTLNRIGIAIVVLLIGGFGGWAATSELAGAVIARGTVVVESNVKKVQHPTGGVVGEILVHDGSEVKAGQVLIRLDDTVTRSTLGVVRSQLDESLARQARLLAERDGADTIVFPDELTARSAEKSVADARWPASRSCSRLAAVRAAASVRSCANALCRATRKFAA